MDLVTTQISDKLKKLEKNMKNMTKEQKNAYSENLKKFRRTICREAMILLTEHMRESFIFLPTDEAGMDLVHRMTAKIISEEAGKGNLTPVFRVLFQTYSIDDFLDAAQPLFTRCFYQAYGMYWTAKCKLVDGKYYNHVIDMTWNDDLQIWQNEKGNEWTLMMPPTKKLVEKAYEEERKRYREQGKK